VGVVNLHIHKYEISN